MLRFIGLAFILFLTQNTFAQTVVGKWVSIDDKSGQKKSVVELFKKGDKLYGKITYLYPREGRAANPKCDKCTDDRKGQPWIGMEIIRGLTWNGSEWEDGTVLDPGSGKVYNVTLWRDKENPDYLNIRGYVGPFFRTQRWLKVE